MRDENGFEKIKTMGKMLDEKLQLKDYLQLFYGQVLVMGIIIL